MKGHLETPVTRFNTLKSLLKAGNVKKKDRTEEFSLYVSFAKSLSVLLSFAMSR